MVDPLTKFIKDFGVKAPEKPKTKISTPAPKVTPPKKTTPKKTSKKKSSSSSRKRSSSSKKTVFTPPSPIDQILQRDSSITSEILEKSREAPKVMTEQGKIEWAKKQLAKDTTPSPPLPSKKAPPKPTTPAPSVPSPIDKVLFADKRSDLVQKINEKRRQKEITEQTQVYEQHKENIADLTRQYEEADTEEEKAQLRGALAYAMTKAESAGLKAGISEDIKADLRGPSDIIDTFTSKLPESDFRTRLQTISSRLNRPEDEFNVELRSISDRAKATGEITKTTWETATQNRQQIKDDITYISKQPSTSQWIINGQQYSKQQTLDLLRNQLDSIKVSYGEQEYVPGEMSYKDFQKDVSEKYRENISSQLKKPDNENITDAEWDNIVRKYRSRQLSLTGVNRAAIEAAIPDLPSYFTTKEGEDVFGIEPEYRDIMRKRLTGQLSEDEAQKLLESEFKSHMARASEEQLSSWYPEKTMFVRPSVQDDINKYTETYNTYKDISEGKVPWFSTAGVDARKVSKEEAKQWLAKNKTPEQYAEQATAEEDALVDWDTYSKEHPDKRALKLVVDPKGTDLGTIFKPTLDYEMAEKAEWKELGQAGGSILEKTAAVSLSPLVYGVGSLAKGEPLTLGEFSKTFVVGATQFPRTIWTAASAVPPALESGDYWKEYDQQLKSQLYEAGYKLSKGARIGRETGDWVPYITEVGTSPAITDVVIPLATGAGFSAIAPKIAGVAGKLATKGGRLASKIASKAPKLTSTLSKVGSKVATSKVGSLAIGGVKTVGRGVMTPYGMTTLFYAPTAAEMGAQTALYHKGAITRQQWVQSLQRGARTGFQLGMFSYGAAKSSPLTAKSIRGEMSAIKKSVFKPKILVVSKEGAPFSVARRYVFDFGGKPRFQYGQRIPVDVTSQGIRSLSRAEALSRMRRPALTGYSETMAYDLGRGTMGARPTTGLGVPWGSEQTGYLALPERATQPSGAGLIKRTSERGITSFYKPKLKSPVMKAGITTPLESGVYPHTKLVKPGYEYTIPEGSLATGEIKTTMFGTRKIGETSIKVTKRVPRLKQTRLSDYSRMYPEDYSVMIKPTKQSIYRKLMPEEFLQVSKPKVPETYAGPYRYVKRGGGLLPGETSLDKFGLKIIRQSKLSEFTPIKSRFRSLSRATTKGRRSFRLSGKEASGLRGRPRSRTPTTRGLGKAKTEVETKPYKEAKKIQVETQVIPIDDKTVTIRAMKNWKKTKPFEFKPPEPKKPDVRDIVSGDSTLTVLKKDTPSIAKQRSARVGAYKIRPRTSMRIQTKKKLVFKKPKKKTIQLTLEGEKLKYQPLARKPTEQTKLEISRVRPKGETTLTKKKLKPLPKEYYEKSSPMKYPPSQADKDMYVESMSSYWKDKSPYFEGGPREQFIKTSGKPKMAPPRTSPRPAKPLRINIPPAIGMYTPKVISETAKALGKRQQILQAQGLTQVPRVEVAQLQEPVSAEVLGEAQAEMQEQAQLQEQAQMQEQQMDYEQQYETQYQMEQLKMPRISLRMQSPRTATPRILLPEDEDDKKKKKKKKMYRPSSIAYKEKMHEVPKIWKQATTKQRWAQKPLAKKPDYIKLT